MRKNPDAASDSLQHDSGSCISSDSHPDFFNYGKHGITRKEERGIGVFRSQEPMPVGWAWPTNRKPGGPCPPYEEPGFDAVSFGEKVENSTSP